MNKMEERISIKFLKKLNYSAKQISNTLGVAINRVYRWSRRKNFVSTRSPKKFPVISYEIGEFIKNELLGKYTDRGGSIRQVVKKLRNRNNIVSYSSVQRYLKKWTGETL